MALAVMLGVYISFMLPNVLTKLANIEPKIYTEFLSDEPEEYMELPIIMYHALTENPHRQGEFVISVDLFENDLKYMKENEYNTIIVQDLVDYVEGKSELPENPIMITFDDGYYNNYIYAFPLIKEYGFKVVLSPIGKQTDEYTENSNTNLFYAHCSWEHLKEMHDSGCVEIQNHSYNMHKRSGKRKGAKKLHSESLEEYKKVLTEDFSLMQQKVEKHLGYEPIAYTYPFGAISYASVDILKEAGFKALLSCEGKVNKIRRDPDRLYHLCRMLRTCKPSTTEFFEDKIKNAIRK